ncbi:hypothetical protein JEQ12_004306 [Ovis aries]|uniref:NADP-dependent oxidoreductase domain-containing protein n=2 Tax=Ovis aries TaxID=9940 RepID=A0A835ZUJ2_SHEEP|nr:hypothetical protein JEQ12_004306 [Ovis aries]
MDPQSQKVKLNDGRFIPVLGFGTYAPPEAAKSEALEVTKFAIEVGFRHIDCAYVYQNEEQVGQAIQSKISDGTVKREDIFYTSKLWCTFLRPELVRPALEKSLKNLQLDYVDLYIIHFPLATKPGEELLPKDENGKLIGDSVDLCHTWEALEKCKDAGLTKSIGVSNFNHKQLEKILNKPGLKYKPVCNQVECHPYLNQSKLLDFCKSHDIVLVAYGALGSQRVKEWVNLNHPVLLEDPVLSAIAKKHKQTPALVALRYQIQRGVVVLAKSYNKKRIKENIQVFDFELTPEDMKAIDGLNRNIRYYEFLVYLKLLICLCHVNITFSNNLTLFSVDILQVECHPYLNQSKLLDFCKSHDIVLLACGVLGSQGVKNAKEKYQSAYSVEQQTMDPKGQRVKLNDGHFIPVLGFGTFAPPEVPKSEALEVTKFAIEVGFRHIDSAHLYQNEEQVGQAIRSKIADGTVKREDVFYTSKLWSTSLRPELVRPALEKSLNNLQLDYVDLYIIHFPVALKPGEALFPKDENGKPIFDSVDLCRTWEALEKCKDAGLTKSIGVSNFNHKQLEKILNKPGLKYKPVCNQVECHPYLNQSKLLDFCKSHDIVLVAYGALGSQRIKEWVNPNLPFLLEDPVLSAIAKKHKQTPAVVALRYQIQRGVVVLAKSYNKKRIKENIQVFDFELTPEDMKAIDGLNRSIRYNELLLGVGHPEYPFFEEY